MRNLESLEPLFDDLFVKKAPRQIPEPARKNIVELLPLISLVLGLFALWNARLIWDETSRIDRVSHFADSLNYYVTTSRGSVGFMLWLYFGLLMASGILLLVAVAGLNNRSKKRGWNLAFYGVLLGGLHGMIYLFAGMNDSFVHFVSTIVSILLGLYILFQIRGYYTKDVPPADTKNIAKK